MYNHELEYLIVGLGIVALLICMGILIICH